ncbi:hypothetical protein [Melittangium boletus]|uniref:hypothetical protein n=1 Tax=Melittangium boletus TaxID=83453 RepID=UPI003183D06B
MSFVCAVALGVAGCPKPSTPTDDAGVVVTAPTQDSGVDSAVPAPAVFTLQYALPDAGMEPIPFVGEEEGRPLIEPTSTLELRGSQSIHNYRVRIFDEADRALSSDDAAEESSTGLVYRISLPTPLKAGHRYVLVIDAQSGTSMTDAQGRELADIRLAFQVSGEKEKPPPPAKKQKQRRR